MTDEYGVVGPVVGPIGSPALNSAATRYTRSGAQYDFAIGGLPFASAISDERPYARETAAFRKEQVDQSSSVGDQSLTGYWTRGQASFHRGAGVRFYEILEGAEVSNRFLDSLDVDVWTPGEVKLKPAVATDYTDPVADAVLHNGNVVIRNPSDAVYEVTYAGSGTAKASSDANPITSITSDGVNVYGTNDTYIERLTPGGSFSVLWTHHVGGRSWSHVFWAKDRLWAVDDAGEWYTLSTAGGTTSGSDILWTSGKGDVAWSLTDGAGGVFISTGNTIFLSILDTSTSTPTLAVPVVVATVGEQETISVVGAYLGYLMVCSDAGARLGRIQAGGIVMGNLIVEGDFSRCTRLSFRKDLVQAVGYVDAAEYLFEFNILEQITELAAAYAPTRAVGISDSDDHGSLVLPDGRTASFSSTGLHLETTDVGTSGFVQTGYHRFGTLEPKDFRTLSLRAEGIGGAVTISKVLRNGSIVSMVTLGVGNYFDNEIPLNLSGPTDFIGLKFTLHSDEDGNAPTLLGYQLRALPAPKRQRLIQVPLLCFDVERIGRRDYGHEGWAWSRLAALEAAESGSSVIQFQDFTTGETVPVAVESVQFQRRTPTTQGNEGFGGFIVLTLRKVV